MYDLSVRSAARDPRHADAPALLSEGRVITYSELGERTEHIGAALRARFGDPRTPIAFVAAPDIDTISLMLGAIDVGVPFLPLHARLTSREISALVGAASATLLERASIEALAHAPARHACSQHGPHYHAPAAIGPEAPLAVVATSGTTGLPKAAVLPRRAFVASARATAAAIGTMPGDRWLLCLSPAHIGGLSIVTRSLIARRTVVLAPRFDPEAVLRACLDRRVTLLSVVPTMLRALLDADVGQVLCRLRAILVGGAPTPRAWIDECAERGVVALPTYGLTEACSQVATVHPGEPIARSGDCGAPLPGVGLRIVDGCVHVRGPMLMSGYVGHAPRAVGAWFDTGDLGELVDGRLVISGRRDDVIITGGENVSPSEIERVLEACPGVERACVFGVDDARWGQLVACALVTNAALFDSTRLAVHLREQLAPFKRPRRFGIVASVPTTPAGKIDRRRLARELADALRVLAL